MCLIDDDETHIHLLHIIPEKRSAETFRRDIEELEIAICCIIKSKLDLTASHSGIDAQCLDAPSGKVLDLILHQCDQRSDYNGDSFTHHRRHLEAYGLASTGRQDSKHIPSLQSGIHYILLLRTERLISPIFPEDINRVFLMFMFHLSPHYFEVRHSL